MTEFESVKPSKLRGHWSALVILSAVLTQCFIGANVSRVEGSIAQLLAHNDPKSSDSNLVVKDNRLDPETLRDIDNGVRSFEANLSAKLLEGTNSDQTHAAGFFGRIHNAAKVAVAPAQAYYDLAIRYKNWRSEHRRLQQQLGRTDSGEFKVKDAMEVLRLEYAKVDRMLQDEMCQADTPIGDFENVDLIVKILSLLIDRLEVKLAATKANGAEPSEADSDQEAAERRLAEIEANAGQAIRRAKRIAARSAINLVQNELATIVKLLACDMAASYVLNQGQVGADGLPGLLGRLEPFVLLIGSVNTPILVSYLRNVRLRAVLTLVNRSVSALACLRSASGDENKAPQ